MESITSTRCQCNFTFEWSTTLLLIGKALSTNLHTKKQKEKHPNALKILFIYILGL